MAVSARTFEQVALEEPNQWELHRGDLRRKPAMTADHNEITWRLAFALMRQIDQERFTVRANMGHVRSSSESYFIPDVYVVPLELLRALRGQSTLEVYAAPLPLVVEVWSPSTGNYDIGSKFPEYRRRGDLEIWRIHPSERTLTAWVRQPDGTYAESLYVDGTVHPAAFPGIEIDLDALFA